LRTPDLPFIHTRVPKSFITRRLAYLLALLAALQFVPVTGRAQDAVRQSDLARIRGVDTAKVWLVIVGDMAGTKDREFQRDVWPVIDSLYVRPGRIRVGWVNLPDDASPASFIAAEVAACAGVTMKFWASHDFFLLEQPNWSIMRDPTARLVQLAMLRGADSRAVPACVKGHEMREFVRRDIARARAAGIRKAPGFLVDNQVVAADGSLGALRKAIDQALARH
jgi:protein-disulfide isomerase